MQQRALVLAVFICFACFVFNNPTEATSGGANYASQFVAHLTRLLTDDDNKNRTYNSQLWYDAVNHRIRLDDDCKGATCDSSYYTFWNPTAEMGTYYQYSAGRNPTCQKSTMNSSFTWQDLQVPSDATFIGKQIRKGQAVNVWRFPNKAWFTTYTVYVPQNDVPILVTTIPPNPTYCMPDNVHIGSSWVPNSAFELPSACRSAVETNPIQLSRSLAKTKTGVKYPVEVRLCFGSPDQ